MPMANPFDVSRCICVPPHAKITEHMWNNRAREQQKTLFVYNCRSPIRSAFLDVIVFSLLRNNRKHVKTSGAQNKDNLIKPVVFSIFCCSKGLRRRAAGRPPDGRRTPPGPPKNIIKPVVFKFSAKNKSWNKNTRTMKYVMFIVPKVKDTRGSQVVLRCQNDKNVIKPQVFDRC